MFLGSPDIFKANESADVEEDEVNCPFCFGLVILRRGDGRAGDAEDLDGAAEDGGSELLS